MWGLHTYCRPYLLLRPLQRVACYFREGRKHSLQEEQKLMIDLKIHQFQNLQVYYSDFSAKLLATLVWILTWWSFWRFDRYSWWHCRSQGFWPMCVRVVRPTNENENFFVEYGMFEWTSFVEVLWIFSAFVPIMGTAILSWYDMWYRSRQLLQLYSTFYGTSQKMYYWVSDHVIVRLIWIAKCILSNRLEELSSILMLDIECQHTNIQSAKQLCNLCMQAFMGGGDIWVRGLFVFPACLVSLVILRLACSIHLGWSGASTPEPWVGITLGSSARYSFPALPSELCVLE